MLARWFVAGPTRLATIRSALLAQSAEHSHGKAWVVGSIPTEGSTRRSAKPSPGDDDKALAA